LSSNESLSPYGKNLSTTTPLKVVHFSQSDIYGGAAKTALRLHQAMLASGVESKMAVLYKGSKDPTIIRAIGETGMVKIASHAARHINARIDQKFHPNFGFSADLFRGPKAAWEHLVEWADVINLHYINGFLTPGQIFNAAEKHRVPVVWTLQDFSPITGGCHYPGECSGWKRSCGSCPVLSSKRQLDFSRIGWHRRSFAYKKHVINFVAQSSWCKDRLMQAALCQDHKITEIPFVGDKSIFKPLDKRTARAALGLPEDGLYILCLAADFEDLRKGSSQLLEILKGMSKNIGPSGQILNQEVRLLTVGHVNIVKKYDLPWKHHHLDFLSDDRLTALAYQASNLYLSTSIEDIGPQTPVESMLCGTPVVSFDVGTARDLIENRKNGFLIPSIDLETYIKTACEALSLKSLDEIGIQARRDTLKYHSPDIVASQYLHLYHDALATNQV